MFAYGLFKTQQRTIAGLRLFLRTWLIKANIILILMNL